MPQASDKSRALMEKWFGDAVDTYGPARLLSSHGYTQRSGCWFKPTRYHTVSTEEAACLDYLFDEWDFCFEPTSQEDYIKNSNARLRAAQQ